MPVLAFWRVKSYVRKKPRTDSGRENGAAGAGGGCAGGAGDGDVNGGDSAPADAGGDCAPAGACESSSAAKNVAVNVLACVRDNVVW
ncbi:MAG: hypothetical protein JWM87_1389 [Candidatus Eremiobacteraeota bacterium]|nr:hypothetical protein [Candidatus Eremiobacteraeota bacterium]